MGKILAMLLALAMVFSLAACAGETQTSNPPGESKSAQGEITPTLKPSAEPGAAAMNTTDCRAEKTTYPHTLDIHSVVGYTDLHPIK